ncbi:hypothetical protein [Oerskovia enterophila]|uniref:hypothetical protein n=1 Tax=Oerskovia enterophila TaxID=43678 RepID=UPI003801DD5A
MTVTADVSHRNRARMPSWGWSAVPVLLACIVTAGLLHAFSVPLAASFGYAVYWALVIGLPGTLLWRFLRVPTRSLLEDVVVGTTLGLALQTVLVWGLSSVGLDQWAPLWAVLVLALAVVHPSARFVWRRPTMHRPVPAGVVWLLAAISVTAVWWVARTSFLLNEIAPLPGRPSEFYAVAPYIDMSFQQALVSAVARPWPLEYPYVAGVPLDYTLMVYEHLSDIVRWVGTDTTLVVMRLFVVPLLVLLVLACGVLTMRLVGRWWAAPLGALLAVFAAPINLSAELQSPFFDVGTLSLGTFRSPTQSFGEPLFVVLILLTCIFLRSPRKTRLRIVLPFVLLAFVAAGAKATFLPLLGCGLLGVLVCVLLWDRRRSVGVVVLGGLIVLCTVASLLLVVGTNSRSLEIGDGRQLLARLPLVQALGDLAEPKVFVVSLALVVGSWLLVGVGAILLLWLRPRDPRLWLLGGIVGAAVGATLVGQHPGLSQAYFIRSAWPVVGVLSAWGISVGLRRVVGNEARIRTWLPWVAAGFGVAVVLRELVPWTSRGQSGTGVVVDIALRGVLLGLVLAGLAVLCARTLRGSAISSRSRTTAVAGATALAMLLGGATLGEQLSWRTVGPAAEGYRANGPVVPEDVALAARWIRDNSAEESVIATNGHCVSAPAPDGGCDARRFWVSALAERQVLVEGWSYANPPGQVAPGFRDGDPFWDGELLALNDKAFSEPDPALLSALAERYGVGWLLVDRSVGPESAELADHADLVLDLPGAAVYRLDSGSSG